MRYHLLFTVCALFVSIVLARGTPKVIYGSDDRLDYFEVSSSLQSQGNSAVVILFGSDVTENSDGSFTFSAESAEDELSFCSDERFSQQDVILSENACSGFLLSTNPPWIGTAAHCVELLAFYGSNDIKIVFDYDVTSSGNTRSTFAADQVYEPTSILVEGTATGGAEDYGVFVLDRPVVGYEPYRTANGNMQLGDGLVMIGHPSGLPKKFDSGGEVVDLRTGVIGGTTDSYGGNSGSPVFDNSGNLAGILVGGAPDFVSDVDDDDNTCIASNVCPGGSGCTSSGENIVPICDLLDRPELASLGLCANAVSSASPSTSPAASSASRTPTPSRVVVIVDDDDDIVVSATSTRTPTPSRVVVIVDDDDDDIVVSATSTRTPSRSPASESISDTTFEYGDDDDDASVSFTASVSTNNDDDDDESSISSNNDDDDDDVSVSFTASVSSNNDDDDESSTSSNNDDDDSISIFGDDDDSSSASIVVPALVGAFLLFI